MSLSTRRRGLLYLACLAGGVLVGLAGQALTGNQRWFLAVPAPVALAWLLIADPSACCVSGPSQGPRCPDQTESGPAGAPLDPGSSGPQGSQGVGPAASTPGQVQAALHQDRRVRDQIALDGERPGAQPHTTISPG